MTPENQDHLIDVLTALVWVMAIQTLVLVVGVGFYIGRG